MGENKHIKELDAFTKKYVQKIEQEEPSLDFTASLMDIIVVTKMEVPVKTTPLISKKVWFAIAIVIVAILGISYQSSENQVSTLLKMDFSFMDKLQMATIFENLQISNTTFYAFLFFGLMIVVQFVYLKNHFHKQFN